jgi:hypothetical protein
MKIKIGPYKNCIGPYQIMDAIFFWHERYPEDKLAERWDYKLHDRMSEWLANTWVNDLCEWIQSKRERNIKIRIDPWDTWGMDHTLAMIVVPMLKQLQATKHGSPMTDDEDVPEHLRSTSAPDKENQWDVDSNHFKRWDWIMDEMIWTFEQLSMDDSTDQFFTHPNEDEVFESNEERLLAIKIDNEGLKKHEERISNGLRLFGKYYRGLWD